MLSSIANARSLVVKRSIAICDSRINMTVQQRLNQMQKVRSFHFQSMMHSNSTRACSPLQRYLLIERHFSTSTNNDEKKDIKMNKMEKTATTATTTAGLSNKAVSTSSLRGRLQWWWDSMNLPNSLTMARIVFTPYLAWLIVIDERIDLAIFGCFFTGILDYFDGYFAKKYNMKTVLGSFLDPLADKIFIGTMILSLTYKGIFPYQLALVIVGRDAFLLAGSFVYRYFTKPKDVEFFAVEGEGVIEAKPTQLSRINTVLQMSAFGFSMTNAAWGFPPQEYLPYFYFLVASTTIGSGIQYLSLDSLKQKDNNGNAKPGSQMIYGKGNQGAMVDFFSKFESSYGQDMKTRLYDKDAAKIIVDNKLTTSALNDLFQHRCGAIHIKGFYANGDKVACDALAQLCMLQESKNWQISHPERGVEDSDVETIGTPMNVAASSGVQGMSKYAENALMETRRWRQTQLDPKATIKQPFLSPLDQLRLELDEMWTGGAMLGRMGEKNNKVANTSGLVRIMKRTKMQHGENKWVKGFAHVDDLSVMSTSQGSFSGNVYLKMAPVGGEVQIWPISIKKRLDFYRNIKTLSNLLTQDPVGQELLRKSLPEPITISPQQGDLLLLCVQRPHGVVGPIHGGNRVSMQTFIQYNGLDKPLKIES